MLCQLNTPERATITDDVNFRMLCWHTDIYTENSKFVGFTQNNVNL